MAAGAGCRHQLCRSAHQQRQCPGRGNAFAHDGTAHRPDAVEGIEAKAPQSLNGQKIGQQRPVEEVNRNGAARNVGPPTPRVFGRHVGRADIAPAAPGSAGDLAEGDGVAQAEIETLGADRREYMGGLADQGDAVSGEPARGGNRQGEGAMAGFDLHLAEDRMAAPFDLGIERTAAQPGRTSACAGATTQTRLERQEGSGTTVNGPSPV